MQCEEDRVSNFLMISSCNHQDQEHCDNQRQRKLAQIILKLLLTPISQISVSTRLVCTYSFLSWGRFSLSWCSENWSALFMRIAREVWVFGLPQVDLELIFNVNETIRYAAEKRETHSGDSLWESAPRQIQFHTPDGSIFTVQWLTPPSLRE